MKKHRFFIAIGLVVAALFVSVSSGLSLWLFESTTDGKKASVEFQGNGSNPEDKVIINDIAENYYFGSNIDADEYYDLYFFAQPQYSFYKQIGEKKDENFYYIGGKTQAYESPIDYFNAEVTSMTTHSSDIYDGEHESKWTNGENRIYQNNHCGYWGNRTYTNIDDKIGEPNSSLGSTMLQKPEPLPTGEVTPWGYKKISNVYRQLNSNDYSKLGDCYCTQRDKSNWFKYFVGFTSDVNIAQKVSYKSTKYWGNWLGYSADRTKGFTVPTFNTNCEASSKASLLDLTVPLSNYWGGSYSDSGRKAIYFYAVYTNGTDYTDHRFTTGQLLTDCEDSNGNFVDVNTPPHFQWMFLPNDKPTGFHHKNNDDISFYFKLSSVEVADIPSDTKYHFSNVIYRNKDYYFRMKDYAKNSNEVDNWDANSRLELTNFFKDNLTSGCFYNIYLFYNERSDTTPEIKIDTDIVKYKNIIEVSENNNVIEKGPYKTDGGAKAIFKIYIERIYDYKLTGDISGSYDYHDNNAHFVEFGKVSQGLDANGKVTQTYIAEEVSFTSKDFLAVAIDNGNGVAENIDYDKTCDADKGLELATLYDKDDKTKPIYNPSGGIVFYGYQDPPDPDIENYQGNYNKFTIMKQGMDGYLTKFNGLTYLQLGHAGNYNIKFTVTYEYGLPIEIKVAIAYLNGRFIEIHEKDPTKRINNNPNGFISHEDSYLYRCFFSGENPTANTTVSPFLPREDGTAPTTIKDYLDSKQPTTNGQIAEHPYYLADHVAGVYTRIQYHDGRYMFTTNNGATWSDTFDVNKNYIFYLTNQALPTNKVL